MRKQLLSIILLLSTLLAGFAFDLDGSVSARDKTYTAFSPQLNLIQNPHYYEKGLGGKPHFNIISEVLDSEEEVSVEKKSPSKSLSQSISFNDSSLYFFGYVSGRLAQQSYCFLKHIPTYLLLQVFRL
tara:strand:+ start:2141 stop:2524 length:384 start_codon:yes stop_codon:yes gene_type:complete